MIASSTKFAWSLLAAVWLAAVFFGGGLHAQQQIRVATPGNSTSKISGTVRGDGDLSLIIQTASDEPYFQILVTADRKHLLTFSDSIPRLWDIATGCLLREFTDELPPMIKLVRGRYELSTEARYEIGAAGFVRLNAENGQPQVLIAKPIDDQDAWSRFVVSPDEKLAAFTHLRSAAISLYDLAGGKLVHRLAGHGDRITALQFSADGKQLLTASEDRTIRLWSVADGREQTLFAGHFDSVAAARFADSPGKILSASEDGTIRTWDAATGAELARQQIPIEDKRSPLAVTWLGDDRVIVANWLRCGLFDTKTGAAIRRFESKVEPVSEVQLSHDGKWLAVVGMEGGTLRLWNLPEGRPAWSRELGLPRDSFDEPMSRQVQFSADDQLLVQCLPHETRVYQTATGKLLFTLPIQTGPLSQAGWLAEHRFAVADRLEKVGVWNVATGKSEGFTLSDHPHTSPRCMAISADGRRAVVRGRRVAGFDNDERFYLRNLADDQNVVRLDDGGYHLREFRFGAGGEVFTRIEEHEQDTQVLMFDPATGKIARKFPLPLLRPGLAQAGFRAELLASPADILAVRLADSQVALFDVATARPIGTLRGHTSVVTGITFLPGGKFAITSSRDQTCRVWQLPEGKDLGSLVGFTAGDWAVVDQQGRFDASNAGDVEGMQWVVDNEPIALKQLKHRYFEPKLLPKLLGLSREPLREVGTFTKPDLYPQAELIGDDLAGLQLKLDNRGGGIGRVQVFINGKELLADARGPKPEPDAKSATLPLDLSGAPLIPGQPNQVEVVTWNKDGYLASRGCVRRFEGPLETPEPARLFALVAGVSTYDNAALNLRFAAKDAEDFATAMELCGRRLFGVEQVRLRLLTTSDDPRAQRPTKANFAQVFSEFRAARPGDVLVVYLAGHGLALAQGADLYCYLTTNARGLDPQEFGDPAVRAATSITSDELAEWIKQIPALKQVLILDTCAAGAAVVKLTEKRDVPGDQIRAIERFKDRTGFHVLMGCSADRVSYEASQYAQGLLTYSLLQGMRGASLREEKFVDVSQLFQYAADRVPELAQNIGGVQRPIVAAPRGTSFDIGLLTPEDRARVPLALVRPILLRPSLLNRDEDEDDLKLSVLLRQRLAASSQPAGRGQNAAIVYVPEDEFPGAVRPTGTYVVDGETVAVRLTLRRDGEILARLQVEGTKTDLAALAEKMSAAILAATK